MAEELVTAAVFGDQTQAIAARLELEAAGIPAFLLDENIAGGLFTLATAVGGIKLQVPESRLEESLRLLDERIPGGGGPTDWSEVDVGQPESDDEEVPEETTADPVMLTTPALVDEELTEREKRAENLVKAWIFGLLFAPIMLFALWQLIGVMGSDERLGPKYRRQTKLAAVMIFVGLSVWFLFCVLPCAGFV